LRRDSAGFASGRRADEVAVVTGTEPTDRRRLLECCAASAGREREDHSREQALNDNGATNPDPEKRRGWRVFV
jgi:hypothetical protein